jgi:hypothetical protein
LCLSFFRVCLELVVALALQSNRTHEISAVQSVSQSRYTIRLGNQQATALTDDQHSRSSCFWYRVSRGTPQRQRQRSVVCLHRTQPHRQDVGGCRCSNPISLVTNVVSRRIELRKMRISKLTTVCKGLDTILQGVYLRDTFLS